MWVDVEDESTVVEKSNVEVGLCQHSLRRGTRPLFFLHISDLRLSFFSRSSTSTSKIAALSSSDDHAAGASTVDAATTAVKAVGTAQTHLSLHPRQG